MKKLVVMLMLFVPVAGYAASTDYQIQAIRSEIKTLERERDKKKADLETCAKQTKGFMIAGITTSAATVGLGALNIVQSKKIKDLNAAIDAKDVEIAAAQTKLANVQELARLKQEKKELEAERQVAQGVCRADIGDLETKIALLEQDLRIVENCRQQNIPVADCQLAGKY